MLHQRGAPVGGASRHAPAAQPAHPHPVELLADVVQLAVELGQWPAQACRGGRGGGDLGGSGPRPLEHRLGQRQDEQQLGTGHRGDPDGGLPRGLAHAVDPGEVVLPRGDEVDLVGGRPGGEGEDDPGEDQGNPGPRGQARLNQPLAVGQRGRQPRALVGDPPQILGVGQDQEAAVQVGVVVDVQVTASTDDEGVRGGDPVDLTGEVQDELVGLLRVNLWHLSPGQVTHEVSFHRSCLVAQRSAAER